MSIVKRLGHLPVLLFYGDSVAVKQEGVKVSVDANFELAFSLQPDLQEILTIVAERHSVDQTTQVSVEYLELGLIESLPTARKNTAIQGCPCI